MVKIMNKKEILELRKTFRPEECNISRIATCYVTSEKEKILEKSQAFLSLPEEEAFKYFDILKQALSGTVGKNLYTLKDEDYDKTVGKENDITIKNLVNPKKMVIQTGTAKVEIDSDYAGMVETKRIDGRLYLAVPLTSNDILVDGCAVRTEALSD